MTVRDEGCKTATTYTKHKGRLTPHIYYCSGIGMILLLRWKIDGSETNNHYL